jgi:hypothetical protein
VAFASGPPSTPAAKGYPSTNLSYKTAVNTTFEYKLFLTYFSLTQSNPALFSVGTKDNGNIGNFIEFSYYVDLGTTINQIGMTLIVFRSLNSDYTALGTYKIFHQFGEYTNNFGLALTQFPAGFVNGFEDKCIIGHADL